MGHPSFVGWNDADNSTRSNTMVIKDIETTAVGIYYIFIILFALLQYLYHLGNRYVLFFSFLICSALLFVTSSECFNKMISIFYILCLGDLEKVYLCENMLNSFLVDCIFRNLLMVFCKYTFSVMLCHMTLLYSVIFLCELNFH